MSAPANFNGQLPVIDADDAVMLLIDHQSGLFQTVNDMPMTALRRHAAALASIATLAKIPVIIAVGKRDEEAGTVAIRRLGEEGQKTLGLDEAIAALAAEARSPLDRVA